MGIVADVLEALDRIPIWKRMQQLPDEYEALKARVEALERRLNPAVGDICPRCKEAAFMLISSHLLPGKAGSSGARERLRQCSACQFQEREVVRPERT